jgi:large subunit ribosomal protein L21
MFAIVEISGTQEKLEKGSKLRVPLQETEAGKAIVFDKVLLLADGDDVTMGAPFLTGVTVEAMVVTHGRGDKIRVVKQHRRKRYKRVKGHRQHYTDIEITAIKK